MTSRVVNWLPTAVVSETFKLKATSSSNVWRVDLQGCAVTDMDGECARGWRKDESGRE
jgi:hypothetical protein